MASSKPTTTNQRLENVENTLGDFIVSTDKRFNAVDKRFDSVDKRFDAVDKRFDSVDKRFDNLETKLDKLTGLIVDNFHSHDKRLRKLESFHNIVQV